MLMALSLQANAWLLKHQTESNANPDYGSKHIKKWTETIIQTGTVYIKNSLEMIQQVFDQSIGITKQIDYPSSKTSEVHQTKPIITNHLNSRLHLGPRFLVIVITQGYSPTV